MASLSRIGQKIGPRAIKGAVPSLGTSAVAGTESYRLGN